MRKATFAGLALALFAVVLWSAAAGGLVQPGLESVLGSARVVDRDVRYYDHKPLVEHVDNFLKTNTIESLERRMARLKGVTKHKYALSMMAKYVAVRKQVAAKDIEGLIGYFSADNIRTGGAPYKESVRTQCWLAVKVCEGLASMGGEEIPRLKKEVLRKRSDERPDQWFKYCWSVYALGLSKDSRVVEILVKVSLGVRGPWDTNNVLYALSLHGKAALYRWIEAHLKLKGHETHLTDDNIVAEMEKAGTHKSAKVKRFALYGIATLALKLQERRFLPFAVKRLHKEKDFQARRQIVYYLGVCGGKEAIEALKSLLDEDDHPIKGVAIRFLIDMKVKEAVPAAIDYLLYFRDNTGCRYSLFKRLRSITHKDFGYEGDVDQHIEAAGKYKNWWEENKEDFEF